MKSTLHYTTTTLGLDLNKPFVDQQSSLLYYTQAKGSTTKFLRSHDTYLTTCPAYVPSLQRPGNVSREVEGCTSASSKHFLGKSYSFILKLLEGEEYTKLVKFLLESVNEVLKAECRARKRGEYLGADFVVLLDVCAGYGIITEHTCASLMRLNEIYAKTLSPVKFIPDSKITQLIKSNSWKYDVSALKDENLIKEDAMEALIILYDFLKENQKSHNDFRHEPFLSNFHKAFIKTPII